MGFGVTRGVSRCYSVLAIHLNHHYVGKKRCFSVQKTIFGISCLKAFSKMFKTSHWVCSLYNILSFMCNLFLVSINPKGLIGPLRCPQILVASS